MSFSKRMWKKAGLALLLAAAVQVTVQAEENKICKEDELVAISAVEEGSSRTEFFDCDGNYVGFVNTNIGGYEVKKVKKDSLISLYEDGNFAVYELSSPMKRVAEYSETEWQVHTYDQGYVLANYPRQEIVLYNKAGESLYTANAFVEEGMYSGFAYINMVSTPAGSYLVYLEPGAQDADAYYHLIGVKAEGAEVVEIAEGFAPVDWEYFALPQIYPLGDYVVCGDCVYDMEGELLMEDAVPVYQPTGQYSGDVVPSGVVRKENAADGSVIYVTYGQNLEKLQEFAPTVPLEEKIQEAKTNSWSKELKYDGNVLTFTGSESLNGEFCTGFVPYCGPVYETVYYCDANVEGWVPCARTEDGAYIALNGELYYIALTAEEEIQGVNDYVCMTAGWSEKEESWVYDVYRLDNGEKLFHFVGYGLSLEKDFIMLGYMGLDSEYKANAMKIDGETYELKPYNIPGAYMPWSNNCTVAQRSIYRGITDSEGHWIVKIINGGTD